MSAVPTAVERVAWFLSHRPPGPAMCANHSWMALGGHNGSVPAWDCSDANEVYDKVVKSGRYFTSDPPYGALVLYRYGNNGHAAIEHTAGAKIATTNPDPDDPDGRGTGVESNSYPAKWGATKGSTIWTDQYNGIRFPVGDEEDDMPSADEIAKAVWDQEVEDPVSGDTTSMRQLVKRIRTVTQQDKDADT